MGRNKDSTTEYQGKAAGNSNYKKVSPLPEKLVSLRRSLHRKAKQEPNFRFYALYDRIYRKDVLNAALIRVCRNKGASGVDGVGIDQILHSEGGPRQLVEELHEELRTKRYKPLRS